MAKLTLVLVALLISTAFAAELDTGRNAGDVYDLITLYNQDTQIRFDELEDRLDSLENTVHNSTEYLVQIEGMEKQYIEERTQPLVMNLLNVIFTLLMFTFFGYLMARHERRLMNKYLPKKVEK